MHVGNSCLQTFISSSPFLSPSAPPLFIPIILFTFSLVSILTWVGGPKHANLSYLLVIVTLHTLKTLTFSQGSLFITLNPLLWLRRWCRQSKRDSVQTVCIQGFLHILSLNITPFFCCYCVDIIHSVMGKLQTQATVKLLGINTPFSIAVHLCSMTTPDVF